MTADASALERIAASDHAPAVAERPLPESLRDLVADGSGAAVRLVDAASGRAWRLAPEPAPEPAPARPPLSEAELDAIDRLEAGVDFTAAQSGTDAEAIRRGLEQADASLCTPWDETRGRLRAELERRIRAAA